MKKFLISMMVALSALAIVVGDAQAKRMGGGGSIGRQSQNVSRQSAAPAYNPGAQNYSKQAAPAAAQQPAQPKPASPWRNILGGALPTEQSQYLPSFLFGLVILTLLVRPAGLFTRGGGPVERV